MRWAKFIRRLVIVMIVGGLIVTALVVLRSDRKSDIGKSVKLADGTTLTLRAVTYGKENRYPGDTAWQRFVTMLPDKLAQKILGNKNLMSSTEPRTVFWLERNGPATVNDQFLLLSDSAGYDVGSDHTLMQLGSTTNRIEGWSFPTWPRRDPTFKLRIYQRGQRYGDDKPIGDFTVRNPTPGPYPTWTASPLPITNNAGDLTVVLFDVTAGVGHGSSKWKPAKSPTISETRAGFYLLQNGKPTRDWEVVSVDASDATGNVITRTWSRGFDRNAEWAELSPHLWPAESAWKLRVGLARRANYEAKDLWGMTISVPELNTHNGPETQTNLNGTLIEYLGQKKSQWFTSELYLNYCLQPMPNDYQLSLVSAVDNNGRAVQMAGSSSGAIMLPSRRFERTFGFISLSNATSVTVTLAMHQTRYVEFLVKPQIVSTNEPPPTKR